MPDGRFPGVINTPRADEKSAIETVSVLLKNAIHGLETMGHTSPDSSGALSRNRSGIAPAPRERLLKGMLG
jgi:hypothetical protein